VPELRLVNRAERPVLIVEGEELVGAKQNRVVNVTKLVNATPWTPSRPAPMPKRPRRRPPQTRPPGGLSAVSPQTAERPDMKANRL